MGRDIIAPASSHSRSRTHRKHKHRTRSRPSNQTCCKTRDSSRDSTWPPLWVWFVLFWWSQRMALSLLAVCGGRACFSLVRSRCALASLQREHVHRVPLGEIVTPRRIETLLHRAPGASDAILTAYDDAMHAWLARTYQHGYILQVNVLQWHLNVQENTGVPSPSPAMKKGATSSAAAPAPPLTQHDVYALLADTCPDDRRGTARMRELVTATQDHYEVLFNTAVDASHGHADARRAVHLGMNAFNRALASVVVAAEGEDAPHAAPRIRISCIEGMEQGAETILVAKIDRGSATHVTFCLLRALVLTPMYQRRRLARGE